MSFQTETIGNLNKFDNINNNSRNIAGEGTEAIEHHPMYEYRLPIFYKRRETLKSTLKEVEEQFNSLKEKLEEVEKVIIEDESQQKKNIAKNLSKKRENYNKLQRELNSGYNNDQIKIGLTEINKDIKNLEAKLGIQSNNKKCNQPGGCSVMGGRRKNKTRKHKK